MGGARVFGWKRGFSFCWVVAVVVVEAWALIDVAAAKSPESAATAVVATAQIPLRHECFHHLSAQRYGRGYH